jgi:hypothetical protein
MIGKKVLHYPPETDQPLADKILEKLSEACLSWLDAKPRQALTDIKGNSEDE